MDSFDLRSNLSVPAIPPQAAVCTGNSSACSLQASGKISSTKFNLLAPEFYIYILAHHICKIWIVREPKKVALWNKRHFEEKNGECAACLKYSVPIFVEKTYIKCNICRVAVRPSYIWDARFLKVKHTNMFRFSQEPSSGSFPVLD
jgi:hypothetical protein